MNARQLRQNLPAIPVVNRDAIMLVIGLRQTHRIPFKIANVMQDAPTQYSPGHHSRYWTKSAFIIQPEIMFASSGDDGDGEASSKDTRWHTDDDSLDIRDSEVLHAHQETS